MELLRQSRDKIAKIDYSFEEASVVHIISGYDTKSAQVSLESNLVEAGMCAPIVHDKGSLCHGRSSLLSEATPIIYLCHNENDFDKFLLDTISKEYDNIIILDTSDYPDKAEYLWKEYYLLLQMYYLSNKLAIDKGIDLTKPNYNRKLVPPLYGYRGKMY